MKENLKQAGYEYVEKYGVNQHILRDKETGNLEVWFNNKNHANYGIKFKNTHLEFARNYTKLEDRHRNQYFNEPTVY
jgi:hypothetical protein